MAEAKGADDLHVFDDLLKSKPSPGSGGTVIGPGFETSPPPPVSAAAMTLTAGSLMARSSGAPATSSGWPQGPGSTHPAAATNMPTALLARAVASPPYAATSTMMGMPGVGGPPRSSATLNAPAFSAPPPPQPLTFTAAAPTRFDAEAQVRADFAAHEEASNGQDDDGTDDTPQPTERLWFDDDDEEEQTVVRRESVPAIDDNWEIPSPNPFLSPLMPPEQGGPQSLLPPPPSAFSAPPSQPHSHAQSSPTASGAAAPSAWPLGATAPAAPMVAPMPVLGVQGTPRPSAARPPTADPSVSPFGPRAHMTSRGQPTATLIGGNTVPAPMHPPPPMTAPPPPRATPSPAVPGPFDSLPTSYASMKKTTQMPLARGSEPRHGPSTTPPFAVAGTMPPPQALGGGMSPMRKARFVRGVSIAAAAAAVLAIGLVARDRFGTAAAPAAMRQVTAGIRASSQQEGIRLVIDGRERGLLPQDVRDLSPGEHSVVFDGGDRYTNQRSTITLAANEVRELGPVSLRVTRGTATFDVRSPSTALALVSTDERRALNDWSHPVDVDNTKSWMLEAQRGGYKTVRFPIMFDTQAARTFVVSVDDPMDNFAPAAAPAPVPAERPARKAAVLTARAPRAAAPAAEPDTSGTCTLNINSIPPARIALDGRPMGSTPKIGVSVPSGNHVVMFVGETTKKTMTTTCRPGDTKTVATRLNE